MPAVSSSVREACNFDLLIDEDLVLAEALGLPLLEADGLTFLRRLTLIVADGYIQKGC